MGALVVQFVAKVAIDQGIQAPVVLALIITGLAFMEGRGMAGIRQDMGNDYIYSLMQNCKFPVVIGCCDSERISHEFALCTCF
jgi:hypothetical protein